jgi:uncharacterized phage protein gp47/JayE
MADTNAILNRLLTSLSISDPSWDTSVGSATYKIMESVATEIANASNNSTLLTYGLDVTSYFGSELDAFVNIFGITRQLGTRAVGAAVFSTTSPALQNYDVPLGTQISASPSQYFNNVAFTTTSPATIASGQTSVNVPIISTLPGSFNNVSPGSITQITSPLVGITNVTNNYPITGGTDTETDSQLQQRFLNTAFSNFAGTIGKFQSIAQQNPSITQSNVVNSQETYSENLQIGTVVSGTSSFNVGLQTQAQLIATSGSIVASGYFGTLETNVAIPVASTRPAGIYTGNVTFDGVNYNLSGTPPTSNGYLYISYVYSGSAPVTLSGKSTFANVNSTITNLLNSTSLNYNNTVSVTVTGVNTVVSSGATVTFNQNIPWNVVITSGSNVTAVNTITSQIPDSQFSYPAGYEVVGTNLNSSSQDIFTRNTDYYYYQNVSGSCTPTVVFNPGPNNAPFTYTGATVQLQSTYVPISSRTIVSGTQIVNSNFVDIFINSTNTQSVTEQVVMVNANTITTSGTGGTYQANNFVLANNTLPTVGDYYIGFTQNPVANFPNQLISGNVPSYVTFGSYNFPITLDPVVTNGPTVSVSGVAGSNILYTTNSISSFQVGLVISGTSSNTSISGIGTGNYITALIPGNPNQIILANNLTSNISPSSTSWVSVAYPVYDNTKTAGSILDISGFALKATDPTGSYSTNYPSSVNYQVGTISHNYYSDVVNVDNLAQQSRVVGSNTLAHIANFVNLSINFSVVYTSNTNPIVANNSIQNAVTNYLSSVAFDSVVSITSLLNSVSSSIGVQAIRITTQADNPNNYGVQVVNIDGSSKGTPYFKDILLANNQVPALYSINYTVFGVNNF